MGEAQKEEEKVFVKFCGTGTALLFWLHLSPRILNKNTGKFFVKNIQNRDKPD